MLANDHIIPKMRTNPKHLLEIHKILKLSLSTFLSQKLLLRKKGNSFVKVSTFNSCNSSIKRIYLSNCNNLNQINLEYFDFQISRPPKLVTDIILTYTIYKYFKIISLSSLYNCVFFNRNYEKHWIKVKRKKKKKDI